MKLLSKRVVVILLVVILGLVGIFSACAPKQAPQVGPKHKVALLLMQPLGDPFADLCFKGIQRLQAEMGGPTELGGKVIEAKEKGEYREQIISAIELGYNPIVTLWDDLAHEVIDIAPQYPNVKFIIFDSEVTKDLPNVKNVIVNPKDASYVAGVVAAKTTKTKKVGFVGGADIPVIIYFLAGFEAGVKDTDPSVKGYVTFAGTFIDPAKGKELALMLYDKGCDVVMHAANKTGLGVLKAAEERGKWAIGVDMWQGDVAPGHVLWSAIKPADDAMYIVVKEAVEGKFTPGTWIYDPEHGATLYDERDLAGLSPEVAREVQAVVEKIKSGEIKVPTDTATRTGW